MRIRNLCLSAAAVSLMIVVPAAAHEDEKKHDMAMPGMAGEEVAAADSLGFIRVSTPAGDDAVIGRKNPLTELAPEIVTDGGGSTVKVFKLTVEDVKFEIHPGRTVEGWGFNGLVPGPVIRVDEGDRIRIILTNNTKSESEHTIHVHGQRKPLGADGVPYLGQKPVRKGETHSIEFTAANAGTSWYHCHVDSAHHVDMGMYGPFIVNPKEKKFAADREYILVLDEWPTGHKHLHGGGLAMGDHEEEKHGVVTEHEGVPRHDGMGMEKEEGKLRSWYPKTYNAYEPVYDTFVINGRSFPYTEPLEVKEGEKVRMRIINVGYESHFVHTHSHKFLVVAMDGSPVAVPQERDTVQVGPGQRVDILLDADNPGLWPLHCHRLPHVANDHIYPGGMLAIIRYVE
ncbi:multicopper oxidase family protein [Candidatus Moduliflexota bacterium]